MISLGRGVAAAADRGDSSWWESPWSISRTGPKKSRISSRRISRAHWCRLPGIPGGGCWRAPSIVWSGRRPFSFDRWTRIWIFGRRGFSFSFVALARCRKRARKKWSCSWALRLSASCGNYGWSSFSVCLTPLSLILLFLIVFTNGLTWIIILYYADHT